MAVTLRSAMCRLCLQSGNDTSTVSIFSIANGHVIAEIVQRCLGIVITKDISPYENVCSPCIVSLVSMNELYLKYQEYNRTFIEMCLETDRKNLGNDSLLKMVVHADLHAMSPSSVALEDIIEEDYSISDESEELAGSANTLPLKAPTDATFDETVYYLQGFGGYERQAGETDGLLHAHLGQHQPQQTDETEWNHPDGALNKSLMEQLNAQVARLDGQEITNSKATIAGVATEPSSIPQPTKMYPDRAFLKRGQPEENLDNQSVTQAGPCQEGATQELDCYQDPKHHCYVCETSFQNDIELVNHFPAHFLDVPQDCALCGTQHRTVMNLNRHMAYHQPGRPYKCDNCERRFADPQAYKWHVSEFHSRQPNQTPAGAMDGNPQPLLCDICGKLYVLAEPYEQHVLQHELGHQHYQCKLCDRAFSRNIYLLFHLETHAKKRPHRCQYCSMPFASLYLKNFHEKRHPSGDGGPISRRCPLCLTVCRAKHRLLAHIEAFHPADTRIQVLQCSFNDCRLKFLDLNEFQSHITDHRVGDQLPCTYCARVFKKPRLLNAHLRTVHGLVVDETVPKRERTTRTRPALRCEVCSKTFRSDRTFRLHLELSHGSGMLQEDASS